MTRAELLDTISALLYEEDAIENTFVEDGRVHVIDNHDREFVLSVRRAD